MFAPYSVLSFFARLNDEESQLESFRSGEGTAQQDHVQWPSKRRATDDSRISNLPEAIRLHILSFLPMKDAVAAGILSRQWRDLWRLTPNLEFDDSHFGIRKKKKEEEPPKGAFASSVHRFLVRHCGREVRRFKLSEKRLYRRSHPHVNAWLSFAASRNVRELDLHFTALYHRPPSCLLTCKTLVRLKWSMSSCIPLLCGTVSLPALKSLHFVKLKLDNSHRNLFLMLISGCPVLEDLILENCFLTKVIIHDKAVPMLRRLTITNWINIILGVVYISAPTLQVFHFGGYALPIDMYFGNISSVLHATVDVKLARLSQHVPDPSAGEEYASYIGRIFEATPNAETLTISYDCVKLLSWAKELSKSFRGPFHHTKRLKISRWPTSEPAFVVSLLFKICPGLEFLSVDVTDPKEEEPPGAVTSNLDSSSLLIHSLKEVELSNFGGSRNEFEVLKIILEKAEMLKQVVIRLSPTGWNDEEKKNIGLEVLKYPKAASEVIILFC